jgi:DNA-directed RNA polymerase specialized sigma subunit
VNSLGFGELEKAMLAHFVDQLDEPDRTVVEGLFYEQVGLGTLAKRLGKSKRSIGRIRDRAVKRLRVQAEQLLEAHDA